MATRPLSASHRNLRVFHRARQLDADVFWLTRQFPATERYALTRQLRRATRALLHSIERAWQERYRPAAFDEHLARALGTCTRLTLWLELAYGCHYLSASDYADLVHRTDAVGRLLRRLQQQRITMLAGPDRPPAYAA